MGRCLLVGEGLELEGACAILRERGGEVVRVADEAALAAALAESPTPELVVVSSRDAVEAARIVRAARGQVRGEAASLLALVPDLATAEAALEAGASAALPGPVEREVIAAAISAALRSRARALEGDGGEPGHDVLFEKNPNPMWFYDVDTLQFLAVNEAAVDKYGFSREEFLAMTLRDIRPPEEVPRLLDVTAHTPSNRERTFGWRHRTKDGRVFHVEIIASPMVYRGRACELILPHDVSEHIEAIQREDALKAQLAAQDRMASIGALAAAVAHEVNNPLTWVAANVAWLEERARAGPGDPPDEEARATAEAVGEAADGLRRIRDLVRDLRSLSLGDEADPGPCDAAQVLRSAVSIAGGEIRARARLSLELQEGLPPAQASEARLGQVLLNLVTNAAQAIPHGDPGGNELRVSAREEAGRLVLEVADTGTGIAPEVLPRIFEPFFTTRRSGGGTGLGLWIVQRILRPLGGTVEALPNAPRGTIMRVTLPAAPRAAAPRPEPLRPAPSRALPPVQRPRLLVVDDEPLVGRAIRRLLRNEADVEVMSSGRAAVARFTAGERFDLVLCDVMMPELPAPELHAELARVHPPAAAAMVFMTGGAFAPREQAFLASVPNRCLAKPLDLDELRALLRTRAGAEGGG